MNKILIPTKFRIVLFLLILIGSFSCSSTEVSVKKVMDNVVTRFYATMDEKELSSLTNDKVLALLSEGEKKILSSRYWMFDVNVPATVSIMRDVNQKDLPFWMVESGFSKTDMIVRNQEYTYEVWQKGFDVGRVALGINGFDKHRPHYFVAVASQNPNDELILGQFFPENQHIETMDIGAFTYHDWDELVLIEVPAKLKGHQLLTTIRGRAREAHLIHAFRKTPFPSSGQADQVMLTWSGDPRSTQSIQWRTNPGISDAVVRYWEEGADPQKDFVEVQGSISVMEDRLLQNDRYVNRYTTHIESLKPATRYQYLIGSPAKNRWGQASSFQTAPEAPAPFTFVYFGDTHRSPHWGQLINKAFERHPHTAFYSIGGDIVSTGLNRDDWDQLFQYSSEVIKQKPLMSALGNHDSQDGLGVWMYRDLFDLPANGPDEFEPERTYSFEYSNALFLVLDATAPIAEQTRWLESTLAKSKALWKFAIFHFPPYVYESEHDLDYKEIREEWCAVFDKYHVDMVLSGHVHYYMRTKPMKNQRVVASAAEGTYYIISIAIPNRKHIMPDKEFVASGSSGEMLYQTFDIRGNTLTYKSCNIEGVVIDELVIKK
jgi:hypothetical protein